MRDPLELLDALDLVVARGRGVIDDAILSEAGRAIGRMRVRRGFRGSTLVVALIGGTGSGKSSLLNAIAAEPVASVSYLRPHTEQPLAWIPAEADPALFALLDDLEITERRLQVSHPNLAVLDLPDIDSVDPGHRRSVEALLPDLDSVLWLVDPEKYRDPVLHRDFLEPLSRYADQFAFALNKIDLVPEEVRGVVIDDVTRALKADGYAEPVVFGIAADPPTGSALGIDDVNTHLRDRIDLKRIERSKTIGDAKTVLEHLGAAAGIWNGATVGLEERWARDRAAAAARLANDVGPGAREDALCRIEDLVAYVAGASGEAYGDLVRGEFGSKVLEAVVGEAEAAAGEAATPPKRFRRRSEDPTPAERAAQAVLEERVGKPLRRLQYQRSYFAATVTFAAVGLAELEAQD
jgi:GTP-binding protein EngB required for normal cell division